MLKPDANGEDALEYTKEAPLPQMHATDVLIQVKSSAVSNSDKRVISGDLHNLKPKSSIPGCEVSGVIEKVGNAVHSFAVGEEVIAVLPLDIGGGFAEYVVASSDSIVKRPSTVTDLEATALIHDGIMAFTALHYKCHVSGGDSILILNAASSHGWVCLQLAIHFGLKVFVTANTKEDFNALNGSDAHIASVIDVSTDSLLNVGIELTGKLGFDHIIQLNPLPSSISRKDIIQLLAPQGTWVTSESLQLDPPEAEMLLRLGASLAFVFEPLWLLAPTQKGRFLHILNAIMDLASKGILKSRNIATYPLERARQAVRDLNAKPGKIVLRM